MGDSLKTADMGQLPYRVHKQKISDIRFLQARYRLLFFMENRHSSEEIQQSIGRSIFQVLPLSGAPGNVLTVAVPLVTEAGCRSHDPSVS